MSPTVSVLGIAGSLRKASYNRGLLRAAAELLPEGVTLEVADISAVPLYNGDVEAEGIPEPVQALRRRIAAADAILIATPEYNYSVPGVLKNAIDWVSRQPDPPLAGKPAAILGASMGNGGTIRSQHHLRQVAVFLNLLVLSKPEVLVSRAQDKFSPAGELVDEGTRKAIAALLVALRDWTLRLGGR